MPSIPKIAIIGGGPAGLTLAAILQRHSIPFTVFELDARSNHRDQGGSLDLHPRTGQLALREAGLWDEFARRARPESDVMKVVRIDGEVLWDGNGKDKREVKEEAKFDHRPEIDRAELHGLLLDAVDDSALVWGKKLEAVVPSTTNEGTYDLKFADGSLETGFGVVVGADGAWSRVRALLTDVRPHYSGISSLELWAENVETAHPWIAQYVGAGSCFSFDEGRAVQSQRQGDGSIRTLASVRQPETFLADCGIDWTKPDQARKEYVERYFADAGADLQRVVLESSDKLIPRPLFMLPVGHRWEPRAGVTLIGDAAHLMTPFAGVGVNAAMADALELGRAIAACKEEPEGKSVAERIQDYEEQMFPRAEMFAQKTMKGLKGHFSAGGAEHFAHRLQEAFGTLGH